MKHVLAMAVAAVMAATPATARERADLILRHVTVIDVATGTAALDQAVVVSGKDVVATGPDAPVSRRYSAGKNVDASGKYVMPGLWDMHVHFGGGPELIEENKALLPLYVAYGITSVRDAAADLGNSVIQWRSEVTAGSLLGPTIYTSGPKLEGYKPLWKGTIEVGTPAEVDAALDRLQAMKVDFVKITDNTLKPEIFEYVVKAAKARDLKTSAHTPFALTIEQAAKDGLSSVEHLDYLIKAGSPEEAAIAADYVAGRLTYGEASDRFVDTFDADYAKDEYARLARLGLSVTPTLNMSRILAYLDREDHRSDTTLAYIGPGLRKTYEWRVERAAKSTPAQVEARHREYELSVKVLPMLRDVGIPILAGTDAGYLNSFNYPGQGLHDELQRYVEAGLTPREALASATLTGPAFLGHSDRFGGVSEGKAADLLVLDANPLQDIDATRGIRGVVLHGQWLDRTALDGLLEAAKEKASGTR